MRRFVAMVLSAGLLLTVLGLQAPAASGGKTKPEKARLSLFARIDSDGDGKIDEAEFKGYRKRLSAREDRLEKRQLTLGRKPGKGQDRFGKKGADNKRAAGKRQRQGRFGKKGAGGKQAAGKRRRRRARVAAGGKGARARRGGGACQRPCCAQAGGWGQAGRFQRRGLGQGRGRGPASSRRGGWQGYARGGGRASEGQWGAPWQQRQGRQARGSYRRRGGWQAQGRRGAQGQGGGQWQRGIRGQWGARQQRGGQGRRGWGPGRQGRGRGRQRQRGAWGKPAQGRGTLRQPQVRARGGWICRRCRQAQPPRRPRQGTQRPSRKPGRKPTGLFEGSRGKQQGQRPVAATDADVIENWKMLSDLGLIGRGR